MSDFCPCCDNFSIDSSRATRGLVEKPKKKTRKKPTDISVDRKAKLVINVDNSDENADWIKRVGDEGGWGPRADSCVDLVSPRAQPSGRQSAPG